MSATSRHHRAACSGSSHAENGTGRLPCLRRLNRSSSAAATVSPSTTSAAAGSWKTALMPSTRMDEGPLAVEGEAPAGRLDYQPDLRVTLPGAEEQETANL